MRTRRGAVRVKEAESEACILVFVCGVDGERRVFCGAIPPRAKK